LINCKSVVIKHFRCHWHDIISRSVKSLDFTSTILFLRHWYDQIELMESKSMIYDDDVINGDWTSVRWHNTSHDWTPTLAVILVCKSLPGSTRCSNLTEYIISMNTRFDSYIISDVSYQLRSMQSFSISHNFISRSVNKPPHRLQYCYIIDVIIYQSDLSNNKLFIHNHSIPNCWESGRTVSTSLIFMLTITGHNYGSMFPFTQHHL
jgi:hypothetical protein